MSWYIVESSHSVCFELLCIHESVDSWKCCHDSAQKRLSNHESVGSWKCCHDSAHSNNLVIYMYIELSQAVLRLYFFEI